MRVILCVFLFVHVAVPAPSRTFVFPGDRDQRKLEPIITPPVLPVLEHLERDPSTLLPSERGLNPKFGGGFNVKPQKGGFTGSVSSSLSGAGVSHSASQSFSFGFNEGFSASQAASQAASFNGFGGGFSGSQASSQAASFGSSVSAAGSSASAFGGGYGGGQSASSAFGFSGNGFGPSASFSDGLLHVRHRGAPGFTFPGAGRGVAAAAISRPRTSQLSDDFLSIIIS
ncbi:loricrin-like [Aricia agestis]|uniref:loricrin-like n=1 Tax=Aricia agestis TaxID=91739 RepID=UPI001C203175|nr:loricrin-like [Aricia agestis]